MLNRVYGGNDCFVLMRCDKIYELQDMLAG